MSSDLLAETTDADADDETTVEFDANLDSSETEIAHKMLSEYGRSWKVADGLADDANIIGVESWDATKTVDRELSVTESLSTVRMPPSDSPDRDEYVPYKTRYSKTPSGYTDAEIEVHDYAGAKTESCGDCNATGLVTCGTCSGSLRTSCPNCAGNGRESCGCSNGSRRCQTCRGSGSIQTDDSSRTCRDCGGSGSLVCRDCNGAGDLRCSRCDGGGDVVCTNCDKDGKVTCGTCNGEQRLYVTQQGTLEFEKSTSMSVSDKRGANSYWFASASGDRIEKTVHTEGGQASPGGSAIVRSETEQLAVPVRKVAYEFGEDTYSLFDIAGTLQASSYPESAAKRMLPYVAVAFAIVMIAGGYYYFAIL